MRVLDEVLPRYEFESRHAIHVRASPERVRDALFELTVRDLVLTRVLMGVRALPRRMRRERVDGDRQRGGGLLALPGSVELVRRDFEIAIGLAGQFWKPAPVVVPLADADAFGEFCLPGHAKAAMGVTIEPDGDGSRLETSTRIVTIDAAAHRSFGRYWFVIRTGSGVIRREMLYAIKRRAERRSGPVHRAAR